MDPRHAGGAGFSLASLDFPRFLPDPRQVRSYLAKCACRVYELFNPYVDVKIEESTGGLARNELFNIVQTYLADRTGQSAKRLKAEMRRDSNDLVITMDENEKVTDKFEGAKFQWSFHRIGQRAISLVSLHAGKEDERLFYRLRFQKRHRQLVSRHYLRHVVEEGRAVKARNRKRKLFTNGYPSGSRRGWGHVDFQHPATFEMLAMDPAKKQKIVGELKWFTRAKDYFATAGRAWKMGYLLHGPPGTGKSTMIAAMANLLEYDVYDLELTAVQDNIQLRKLLIETTSKSIVVIEDIDCTLDMSLKRANKEDKAKSKDKDREDNEDGSPPPKSEDDGSSSKVTLSGLLNVIDGLWSACAGEQLIVITTNHREKLDPALIRRGRMDRHVEFSYCSFEGFKVLADKYLGLDSHPLFTSIEQLIIQGAAITPADVADFLMPYSSVTEEMATACLENLIHDVERRKEEASGSTVRLRPKPTGD